MGKKDAEKYSDFSNVEASKNYLMAEEFPDGPFGSPIRADEPVELKSTEWEEGQRRYSNFNYENKSFHEEMPRQYPGAHPAHDDPEKDIQEPYIPT